MQRNERERDILLARKNANNIGRFVWFNANGTAIIVTINCFIAFNALCRNFGDHSLCHCTQLTL